VTYARVERVSVNYPIYNADSRSLKRSVIHFSTGGRIGLGAKDRVVVQALKNVSISLEEGDRVGLVGPNGAGKTTLLRVLAGVYEPAVGRLETQGHVVSLFDLMLGMDAEATGDENIVIRGLILGLSPQEIQEKRDEIASFSELGDFLEMPVRTYSAGMALRLAFSVSTAVKPDILLMDEWIGVGDASFVRKAEERARTLIGDAGILVLASHSEALIEQLCNRAIWLEHGEIRADGPTADVLKAYRTHSAG
jgi:lipopolysaccharide transport system ATP-binding protein